MTSIKVKVKTLEELIEAANNISKYVKGNEEEAFQKGRIDAFLSLLHFGEEVEE